jgi:hypothetical protein
MAKRTFETEADIRNFKCKILLLPKKLLMQINQLIDDGKKEWAIENFIKANYKGTLGIPTPPTIGTYIDWYEAKKKVALATGTVIEPTRTEMAFSEEAVVEDIKKEHQSILDNETDISNKKDLLERLIKKCIQRMKSIETLQEMEGTTASLEAVINHYLAEMHKMVQTQLKLSGELAEESNKQIMDVVNKNLYQLVQLFFSTVANIAPEKAEAIKTKFYEELKNQQSLLEVFKDTL